MRINTDKTIPTPALIGKDFFSRKSFDRVVTNSKKIFGLVLIVGGFLVDEIVERIVFNAGL